MINNVTLVGRLTKNIEVKHTNNEKTYANFTIAVNRQYTNQSGEREADFVSCVIWNKAAENLAKFTGKGSLIGIEGRIQTRSYDNSQQQRVYVTEVIAGSFSLLESKPKKEENPHAKFANERAPGPNKKVDSFEGHGEPVDIDDEDLPF